MESPIELLVEALHRRLSRASQAPDPPSLLGSIAEDVVRSLSPAAAEEHLWRVLTALEEAAAGAAGDGEACSPALIATSTALLARAGEDAVGRDGQTAERRWEDAVLELLRTRSAPWAEVRAGASYGTASLAVQGRVRRLVGQMTAMLRLDGAAEDRPSTETLIDVLAQCTSLLVGRIPSEETDVEGAASSPPVSREASPPGPIAPAASGLRDTLVACCLEALSGRVWTRDRLAPAFLCRRVLSPLLLLSRGATEALEAYRPLVHALLQSLTTAGAEGRDEALMLMAALFEYLFGTHAERAGEDYRRSPFLWHTLREALWEAVTADTDAGRRANTQRRAEYLLKRLVHRMATSEPGRDGEGRAAAVVSATLPRSDLVLWTAGRSPRLWELFFLVSEALQEYGLHMVEPVLSKLDALTAGLEEHLRGDATATGTLHPSWLEILYLRLVRHPNVGVRKVGLRRVWGLPSAVLQTFSSSFLCHYLFQSASDPRLCGALDRAPLVTHFLDTKGFEGREEPAVPHVEPLAQEVEHFYAAHWRTLRSAGARVEALRHLLRAVDRNAARFTVSVFLRTFHRIAVTVREEADADAETRAWSVSMILHPEVLRDLEDLLRHATCEKAPFWLEVRLTAIAFSGLLHMAALDPVACRAGEGFWRLLCLCGPLGEPGGRGTSAADVCGQYETPGTSIHPGLLSEQLVAVSAAVARPSAAASETLVDALVRPTTLLADVEALLRRPTWAAVEVKQRFFLVGALLRTGAASAEALLGDLCRRVTGAVRAYGRRAYAPTLPLLHALAMVVELHRELGGPALARWVPLAVLQEMSATVHLHARTALERGEAEAAGLQTTEEWLSPAWDLLRTSAWDVLAAAVVSIQDVASGHPSHEAVESLGAAASVRWLIDFAERRGRAFGSRPEETAAAAEGAARARLGAQILLARNATHLLQSELSGWRGVSGGVSAAAGVATLTGALTQRLTLPLGGSSALSGAAWPVILAQHYRAVYGALYLLCQQVERREWPTVVPLVVSFARHHMEASWSHNLDAVLDLLGWVLSTDVEGVEEANILQDMRHHLREVGARQHVRVTAITCAALHHAARRHPDVVGDLLREMVTSPTVADREIYLAGRVAAVEVLQDAARAGPALRAVLQHLAVFHPAGREEEENESTLATTEPLLLAWPERLRTDYPPTVRLATVARALALAVLLWSAAQDGARAEAMAMELLEGTLSHPGLTQEPCMPGSSTHRARVRCWQFLGALLPLVPGDTEAALRPLFARLVGPCAAVNNPGSVRHLLELAALQLLRRQPGLYRVLAEAWEHGPRRPQVYGTYVLVACHALLHDGPSAAPSAAASSSSSSSSPSSSGPRVGAGGRTPGLFETLFPRVLQQCTSNQHLLRIISHIGLYKILRARLAAGEVLHPETRALFDYIATAPEHVKFREKHEKQLFFDVEQACQPRQLFCAQRKEATTVLQESIPAAYFERIRFLETELACLIGATSSMERLRVWRMCGSGSHARSLSVLATFAAIPHTTHRTNGFVDYTAEAVGQWAAEALGPSGDVEAHGNAHDNIQKKVTPWWGTEIYNELHPRATRRAVRQPLVVVASLLENPVNIAGIYRCGDIFAVEKIVIADQKVFGHPHFIAAARSAELWVPWEQSTARELPGYLESMRQDGYTIVGIEQTADSIPMQRYVFPERSVMVLGAEGHGIPAPLIPLLDVCVEIPQYGLVRSLNVHVTGALVMHEYTRQHLMS